MRFSHISVTKKGVSLTRESQDKNGAIETIDLESPERPLPEFTDALQSFLPYVTDLVLGAITIESEETKITTLNLSVDKNGNRGLIVTAIVPVPNAYDRPIVINTPLVREGGENASDDAFVLSDEVLELIQLAESEATRYVRGERVQGELFAKAEIKPQSENAKSFDDRAAAAEVASTRKPRTKKQKDFIPGTGAIVNPGATEVLSDAGLRNLLGSVDRDVPVDAIVQFTSSERASAERWARFRQREIVGSVKPDEAVPIEPECIVKNTTLPLTADRWTAPEPVRLDDAGVHAVVEAVRGA